MTTECEKVSEKGCTPHQLLVKDVENQGKEIEELKGSTHTLFKKMDNLIDALGKTALNTEQKFTDLYKAAVVILITTVLGLLVNGVVFMYQHIGGK